MTDEFRDIPGTDLGTRQVNQKGHVKIIKPNLIIVKKNLVGLWMPMNDSGGLHEAMRMEDVIQRIFGNEEEKCQTSYSN